MTALEERIPLHRDGQVTWPEPELGKKCEECQHWNPYEIYRNGWGVCDKTKQISGVKGTGFPGKYAIACPQFEVRK